MAARAKAAVVFPAPQKHTSTLFFLHGLGDSAQGGWSDVVPEFQQRFPGLKVVLPNAPVQPVTLNGGMRMTSWHDIKSLSNIDKEDFKGLDDSKSLITALLDEEIAGGIPSQQIILGGFSQGAAMSLYTGLSYPKTLGGIVALSGYLPWNKGEAALPSLVHPEQRNTPVLMLHGEADQVVARVFGERSHKAIASVRGTDNLTWKTYRGMGHHSSEEEMRDLTEWLAKRLA